MKKNQEKHGKKEINSLGDNAVIEKLHTAVDERLDLGYRMFSKYLKMPVFDHFRYFAVDAVSRKYDGKHLLNLASASQCFFWFRFLHSEGFHESALEKYKGNDLLELTTLMGDYFFSQFSLYLIPIDSTPLIDEFSAFLRDDSIESHVLPDDEKSKSLNLEKYEKFLENIFEVLDD